VEHTDAGVNIVLADTSRVRPGLPVRAADSGHRADITEITDRSREHPGETDPRLAGGYPAGPDRSVPVQPFGSGELVVSVAFGDDLDDDLDDEDDREDPDEPDEGDLDRADLDRAAAAESGPDGSVPAPARPAGSSILAGAEGHLADVIDIGLGDIFGEPPEWQERALCAQTDPEAFFPEKGGSTREAKRICSGCDVKAECLEYALANDERFGIWGGMSERERRRLRRRAV
jgi:WhiB family transcriptional regulator, redox-sensing transcriptional regulator